MPPLRSGTKSQALTEPLPSDGLGRRGSAARVIRWIERWCIVPRGFGARKPMRLAPFQCDIVRATFGDAAVRSTVVSIARGNGKSGLAAAIALWGLFDVEDAEVLLVAADERQAMRLLDTCRRMVELQPELRDRIIPYQDRLVCPSTNGVLRALPSREQALHGWNPSLVILDELHLCADETWTACQTAAGKRQRSTLLAISTPAATRASVMWKLVEAGRHGLDPSLRLVEFAAPDGCEISDEDAWRIANPALAAGFLAVDGIRSSLTTTRSAQFRRLRLGQWADHDDSWIGFDQWMQLHDPERSVLPGERVVLGWDGSVRNDASVLSGCTVPDDGRPPFVFIVGIWAKDKDNPNWQVPRDEVEATVRRAMQQYNVAALVADPYFWQAELQRWHADYGNVIEFTTGTPQRMARAADTFYAAVSGQTLRHDGNETLAIHVANATTRETPHGAIPVKFAKNSDKKIDALIAAILAHQHAVQLMNEPKQNPLFAGVIAV
jgi:phage terminase large subunit-like protein